MELSFFCGAILHKQKLGKLLECSYSACARRIPLGQKKVMMGKGWKTLLLLAHLKLVSFAG